MGLAKAIGLIETKGLVSSLKATIVMLNSFDIEFLGIKEIGLGLVTIAVVGEESIIRNAIDLGSEIAGSLGEVYAIDIISQVNDEILDLIKKFNIK